MPKQLVLLPLLLLIAWVIAEYRGSRAARRILGAVMALSLICSVLYQGLAERFAANDYFTSAAKDLLRASVEQLRQGRQDAVLREWAAATSKFGSTYENRGAFAEVVEAAVHGMRQQ